MSPERFETPQAVALARVSPGSQVVAIERSPDGQLAVMLVRDPSSLEWKTRVSYARSTASGWIWDGESSGGGRAWHSTTLDDRLAGAAALNRGVAVEYGESDTATGAARWYLRCVWDQPPPNRDDASDDSRPT